MDEREQFSDSLNDHPAWCFCPDCGGGEGGEATEENEETDWLLYETVYYVTHQIKLLTDTVRKANRTMAFNVKGNAAPRDTRGGRKNNGLPFLDIPDLNKDKKRCVILWAGDPREAGNFQDWARVSVKIEAIESKTKRIWTLGETNPSMDVLVTGLGEDAEGWKGREVFLWLEEDVVTEKKYIRIEVITEQETKKNREDARQDKGGARSAKA